MRFAPGSLPMAQERPRVPRDATNKRAGGGQSVVTARLHGVYLPGYLGRLAGRYAGSHVPR